MHQKGTGGSIDYEDGMLTIHRSFMTQAGDGVDTVRIPATSIVEIKWIPHTLMTNGAVSVSLMLPDGSIHKGPDKVHAMENSPYRLIFHHHQEDGARSIVEAVSSDLTGSPQPLPKELEVHPKTTPTFKEILDFSVFMGDDGKSLRIDGNKILFGTEAKPLAGVTASLEDGSELQSRVTLTRMALAGPLAFAMKKKSGGEKYVVINGDNFSWSVEVNAKRVAAAVKFVNKVNEIASALPHVPAHESDKGSERSLLFEQLKELASLHESGILTDEEFSAAKAKELGI